MRYNGEETDDNSPDDTGLIIGIIIAVALPLIVAGLFERTKKKNIKLLYVYFNEEDFREGKGEKIMIDKVQIDNTAIPFVDWYEYTRRIGNARHTKMCH